MVSGRKQRRCGNVNEKRQPKTPTSTPPRERASRIRLGSIADCRREMGKLYREMRSGKLDTAKGCKLAYVLQSVGKLVEVETIESRIAELERNAHV
jgi:hypothetical protein